MTGWIEVPLYWSNSVQTIQCEDDKYDWQALNKGTSSSVGNNKQKYVADDVEDDAGNEAGQRAHEE